MNIFELVLKQMRQRSLSTCLTLLSVLLGVALAISIMIMRREAKNLFAQTDFGYDVLIGPPKGSPLQLTLNTVYHMDQSPGVLPYAIYADMARKSRPLPGHPDYRPYVRWAVPFMVGDSYKGRRIVGTSPQMFGYNDDGTPIKPEFADDGSPIQGYKFEYRLGKSFEIAEGKCFGPRKFEAVLGSEIARQLHMHIYNPNETEQQNLDDGGAFRATHGMPQPGEKPDIHKPRWHVVGILAPSHTANDNCLFIPFISLYAIAEHEAGLIDQALAKAGLDPSRIPPDRLDEVLSRLGIDPQKVPESLKKKFKMESKVAPSTGPADVDQLLQSAKAAPAPPEADDGEDPDVYHLDEHGDIIPDLPPEEWEISAILVKSRGDTGFAASQLMYNFKVIDDRASAVNPATVMRQFFDTFLSGSTLVLLLVALLVTIVAAVGILVSIYNSVAGRLREIAILRALGATRGTVLRLICLEAAVIGLAGGILGFLGGHGLAALGSIYSNAILGQEINWLAWDWWELLYLGIVVVIATIAGLVPALKAYRTPVATNLVAG
jgi:putative ABC transport system permease protein